MSSNHRVTLAVIGVYNATDGYPNVKYRIKDLKSHYGNQLRQVQYQTSERFYLKNARLFQKVTQVIRSFYAHLKVVLALFQHRDVQTVYIPYPAVFATASLSLLPRSLRPKFVIMDAFISIYDTAIHDRTIFTENSLIARILYRLELQAFHNASVIVTDTEANSRYYQKLFRYKTNKFKAIPLSTNEPQTPFFENHAPISPPDAVLDVLFVGTLVPLHGVQHILKATIHLQSQPVKLTIIGDGQTAHELKSHLEKHPDSFKWITSWQNAEAVNTAVCNADICLGIFGDTDKAQRVCPLKVYTYTSFGKPVITDRSQWTDDISDSSDSMILIQGPDKDRDIANAIIKLVNSPELREELGKKSRGFYEQHLSNHHALAQLTTIIDDQISTRAIDEDNR